VVFLTARVDRISADVRRQMMAFMKAATERKFSQRAASSVPLAVLFDDDLFCFCHRPRPPPASSPKARAPLLLRRVVTPGRGLIKENVDRLVCKLDIVVHPLRARSLQPVASSRSGKSGL